MKTALTNIKPSDFRNAIHENRLIGIWHMMTDFRAPYLGATGALAISALSKTCTYLLLGYFADDILKRQFYFGGSLTRTLAIIGLGFIGLAALEGTFSFLSG